MQKTENSTEKKQCKLWKGVDESMTCKIVTHIHETEVHISCFNIVCHTYMLCVCTCVCLNL